MTLETLYFLAQIVAALAIVGSLIFVGVQIRDQTRERRLLHSTERTNLATALTQLGHGNPEMEALLMKAATADFGDLSDKEKFLFVSWLRPFMQLQYLNYTHNKDGHMDAEAIHMTRQVSGRLIRTPMFRSWWALYHDDYGPGLQAFVEEAFDKGPVGIVGTGHDDT